MLARVTFQLSPLMINTTTPCAMRGLQGPSSPSSSPWS